MLQGKIDSLMAENRYDEIKYFASIKAAIAWSNPNSHLKDMADIAYNYAESPVKMVDELKKLLGLEEPYDGMTRLFLGMIHFNRRNFNELINDLRIPEKSFDEHTFEELLYLVRAYLETTRYDEAVEAQIALEKKTNENCDNKAERKNNAAINRFVFYAFMGWKDEYDAFQNSNKKEVELLPQALRDFWRGVCYFYSGSYDDGEKQMQSVINSIPEDDFVIREFMQKRMLGMTENKTFFDKHVLPKLKELHEKYNQTIADIIKDEDQEKDEVKPQKLVTEALSFSILVVSVIFIVVFNVYDTVELINMGASSSALVKNGEFFRLISYTFIHMGFLHLFMNLLALKFFGPPVETIAGPGAFLAIFFLSGIAGGAMSCYYGTTLTVGASGGVLGLLTAGIIFELFKLKGSTTFSNQSNFSNLIFILIINICYGFIEKGIDNYAHFGGIIAGALLGLLYALLIKLNSIKKLVNAISFVLIAGLICIAIHGHINGFVSNNFYPSNVGSYEETNVASITFKLEIPSTWSVEKVSQTYNGITLTGPFNERITAFANINSDTEQEVIKLLMDQTNKEIGQESDFELQSVIGPEKVAFRENTYKLLWKLKIKDTDCTFVDYVFFDKFFKENDVAYLVRLIIGSKHYEKYDSMMEHIVSSVKLK